MAKKCILWRKSEKRWRKKKNSSYPSLYLDIPRSVRCIGFMDKLQCTELYWLVLTQNKYELVRTVVQVSTRSFPLNPIHLTLLGTSGYMLGYVGLYYIMTFHHMGELMMYSPVPCHGTGNICTGIYKYVLVCTVYVMVCTVTYWYVPVHTSMYQYVLVHTRI